MIIDIDFILVHTAGKLLTNNRNIAIYSVSTDSRSATAGSVFFALAGEHFDGHDYCQMALNQGASAVVVSHLVPLEPGPMQAVIQVDDTLLAMQDLARGYRGLFDIPVVGVTGSVGKTTTKELIAGCLEEKMAVLKTEGNYNNEIGLPMTLFHLENNHQAAVVEMGMRAAGEIKQLADIARPSCAVITNVEPVHLETLGSLENIARAKCEILERLNPEQFALLNGDDHLLLEAASTYSCQKYTFGFGHDCDFRIKDLVVEGSGMILELSLLGQITRVEFMMPSPSLAPDIICAAGAAFLLGINGEDIGAGIKKYRPVGHRLKITRFDQGGAIIDDTYNANPLSMAAALETAQALKSTGKLIAVLGDMFELGEKERESHQWVGAKAFQLHADSLICIGNLAQNIAQGAVQAGMPPAQVHFFDQREEAMAFLLEQFDKKHTWLFKASRGMKFETIIEDILARYQQSF